MSPPVVSAFTHRLVLTTEACATADGAAHFDVRSFVATEAISALSRVRIEARHPSPTLDFDAIVGRPARLSIEVLGDAGLLPRRAFCGVVSELELIRALEDGEGLCSYALTLVPRLWLLTQRRNYRIFQFLSEVEIARQLLDEWQIPYELRVDAAHHPARKYKVQYAETDYEFLYRVLADVGVTFFFEERGEDEPRLVLADAPHRLALLDGHLSHHDQPPAVTAVLFATDVRKSQRVRPNRITLRDRDYRRAASYALQASADVADNNDLELFYYPENFNFVRPGGDGESPAADDRGTARTDPDAGRRLARVDLEARRNDAQTLELTTNDLRIVPGVTFALEGHPSDDLNHPHAFLAVETHLAGRFDSPLVVHVEAVSTAQPYRASLAPRPRIIGVESATVVGPAGEEIHCDEFGRVRVHFHWDRLSAPSEAASCWIPVSQTWGGAGYGGVQIPRVGQEVLVEFLNGDPDRPIITGRVFTAVNAVPMKLPADKTQTVLRSSSTGGGGGYNEIRMEDAAGHELFHIHCQRDKDEKVNRDCNKRVGESQRLEVGQNQRLGVGGARRVIVRGPQSRRVDGSLSDIVGGTTTLRSGGDIDVTSNKGGYSLDAKKKIVVTSEAQIVLRCGESMVVINPGDITIQSPLVAVNPGAAFADYAAEHGVLLTEPVEPEPLPPEPVVPEGTPDPERHHEDPNAPHRPHSRQNQDEMEKLQRRSPSDAERYRRSQEAKHAAWRDKKAQRERELEAYRKQKDVFDKLREESRRKAAGS